MPLAGDPAGPASPCTGRGHPCPHLWGGETPETSGFVLEWGFRETPAGHSGLPGTPRRLTCPLSECPASLFLHLSPTRYLLFCIPEVPYRERGFIHHTLPLHLLSRPRVILAHRGWSDDWRPPDLSLCLGKWAEGCGVGGEGGVALAVGNLPGLGSSPDPDTSPSGDPGKSLDISGPPDSLSPKQGNNRVPDGNVVIK